MIDFLLEGKLCVVNGRICPLNDSFTCVSHKGKSVVDFVVTAHENLDQVEYFKVLPVTDALTSMNLQTDAVGRVSDHALLLFNFTVKNDCLSNVVHDIPTASGSGQSHNVPNTGHGVTTA